MKIEMCDEFFYRLTNNKNIIKEFNSSWENILRNNANIAVYEGEWVRIKINDFTKHYVRPVETIDKIAQFYGTEVEKIVEDNNLKSRKLFIGQMLKIYK